MARRPWDEPDGFRFGLRRTIMGVIAIAVAVGLWLLAEELRLSLSVLQVLGANTPYLIMLGSIVIGMLGCFWVIGGLLKTARALKR